MSQLLVRKASRHDTGIFEQAASVHQVKQQLKLGSSFRSLTTSKEVEPVQEAFVQRNRFSETLEEAPEGIKQVYF